MRPLLFLVLLCLLSAVMAAKPRRSRGFRRLRPSCGNMDTIRRTYPRYPAFPGPVPFPRDMFPFPFFARKGFRGFGIPDDVLDRRMGQPCEGPVIEPLTVGKFQLDNSTLRVSSTAVLITDEKKETGEICLILVDTGSANNRMELLAGLSSVGVLPEYVNNLVLTHLDLDTVGNLNLFPEANVYAGNRRAKGDLVFFPQVAPSFDQAQSGLPFTQLCDNTDIFLSPGFTNDDVSVVVRNVAGYGRVSIVGNLIVNEQDAKTGDSVRRFAQSPEHAALWEASRKEILSISDHLIPGYGPSFAVGDELKPKQNETTAPPVAH
ncbi:Beta-lactamase-like domain-containing protein [Aphelenchoides fujianensis]|nr:Beta-lactamase-like domain-containing protein [Aphelenchoides fujianensis]